MIEPSLVLGVPAVRAARPASDTQQGGFVDILTRIQVAIFSGSGVLELIPPRVRHLGRTFAVHRLEDDRLSVHHPEALHVEKHLDMTV